LRERLSEVGVKPSPANLASMFLHLRRAQRSKHGPWRPAYTWSILDAATTARSLDIERISVLELGVAGGGGLLALEAAAEGAESLLSTRIDVYGFDTGGGLPTALDVRDAPFAIQQGDFAMDEAKLRSRLRRARLLIGDVKDTAREFLSKEPAPIGFISFDLDYYSSTMDSFALLEADSLRLLPRVMCCFDDVLWYPWTGFNGERAAIAEFNATHEQRKISPLYGLRYSLPGSEFRLAWPELLFVAELFDHPLYRMPEGRLLPDLTLRD